MPAQANNNPMDGPVPPNEGKVKWPVYNPQQIEPKWQRAWEETGLYRAAETGENPKFYCLDFFPYPSGDGLHVGHCRNYIPTDVLSRYQRMQGSNVLHPMGWDAFGEPAEQYAVAHGVHPRITTDRNTANFRRQMIMIGASYDWSREIDSSNPEFYRWTQYFFLLLYKRGLAYRDTNWQWWCPVCQTTLSSHEVSNGVCWRGHSGVIRRKIPAWYFRITAYADQLLAGLDTIDWPERIKTMQRDWIGRSEGCEIIFRSETGQPVPVFTTRADTLYGVTFFVLAPEHPLVNVFTDPAHSQSVSDYLMMAAAQSDMDRMMETRPKTGVFTGGYVIHPLSGERIPVWVADYVLPGYGTGAVMGVPAHDTRDFEFARTYNLPIRFVVLPEKAATAESAAPQEAFCDEGWLVNSVEFNGMQSSAAIQQIGQVLEQRGLGKHTVQYHMRDWLISRQRYWGTPIPIIYCQECGEVPVPEEDLPVLLPPMENFEPDGSGRSPLARLPDFVMTTCPRCAGPAQRETDTMGGFADSSWYFLRFTSPHTHNAPFDPQAMRYWMPVDLYVGGAEHAVLHLLYSRFWTKVMADVGLVPFNEPFARLLNQGQLLAPDGRRMSKSRGNVITPDNLVEKFGADALRVYELFMAPFDQDVAWSMEGMYGARRFLNRVWNLFGDAYRDSETETDDDLELAHELHRTIQHVSQRLEEFRFNTLVSALMEFVNLLTERQQSGAWHTATFHQSLEAILLLLAPVAPHISEELWQLTGHSGSVHQQAWPAWDVDLAREKVAELAVQVNGKLRDVVEVALDSKQAEIEERILALPKVQPYLNGKQVVKVIYVPGKIMNIVVSTKKNG